LSSTGEDAQRQLLRQAAVLFPAGLLQPNRADHMNLTTRIAQIGTDMVNFFITSLWAGYVYFFEFLQSALTP